MNSSKLKVELIYKSQKIYVYKCVVCNEIAPSVVCGIGGHSGGGCEHLFLPGLESHISPSWQILEEELQKHPAVSAVAGSGGQNGGKAGHWVVSSR